MEEGWLNGEDIEDCPDERTDIGLAKGFVPVGWLEKGDILDELNDDMEVPVVLLANIDCLNGFVDCTEEPLVVPGGYCCCRGD